MRLFYPLLFSLIGIFLAGCIANTTQSGALGVERSQLLMVSASQMQEGANAAYKEVLSDARAKGILNKDPKTLDRLKTIMNRLIPQTRVFRSDAPSWDWEVNLIHEDTLNAWCMPGGKIAFYSGIIEKLHLSDDEIAAIMGHEMAHALREHSRERASQDQLRQIGLIIAQEVAGLSGDVMKMADIATYYTISLPYSREHERESDIIGIELAARAGYDPYAAVSVWEKMAAQSNSQTPEFLSTHPAPKSRIIELKRAAKMLEPIYLESKQ
jgi:predicted Zn-dependent protease